MNKSDYNYGSFNPSKFDHFSTSSDDKIAQNQPLSRQEKITLGRAVTKLQNKSTKRFFQLLISHFGKPLRDEYLIKQADKYIALKKQIHPMSKPPSETNLRFTDNGIFFENASEQSSYGNFDPFGDLRSSVVLAEQAPSQETTASKTKSLANEKFVRTEVAPSKMSLLEDALRLNTVPDTPDQPITLSGRLFLPKEMKALFNENNTQKKALISQYITSDQASQIATQAKKYPIMQSLLSDIMKNLDTWDDLSLGDDRSGIEQLKGTLEQQMKNLAIFSEILVELSQDPDDSKALSAVSSEDITTVLWHDRLHEDTLKQMFEFLLGAQAHLSIPTQKACLKAILKSQIDIKKRELPAASSSEELAAERKEAPVTTKVIQLQAELHQAIRTGKGWAMEQPDLNKQGTSYNAVYKLGSPEDTSTPSAFFKVGAEEELAAGTMEKLMWDMAVVMGFEDNFVPTGETELRTQKELQGGTEKAMVWDASGELKQINTAQKPRKGGIQVAQEGSVLYDHPGTIPRKEIIRGTLASLVFGMYDAHSSNIFVTKDGKVKFFDNTRSLPNSNGFINRGGDNIQTSYRCALLDRDAAKGALTREEIQSLKDEVKTTQEKLGKLREYMASKAVQGRLKKLPPGWMNLESSMAAMEERVALMDQALISGSVATLEDLAIQSNPGYKMAWTFALMERVIKYGGNQFNMDYISTKSLHDRVALQKPKEIMNWMSLVGIDLDMIHNLCQVPNMSLAILEDVIKKHVAETMSHPPTGAERVRRQIAGDNVYKQLHSNAAVDFKDWSRDYCKEELTHMNFTFFLQESGISWISLPGIGDPELLGQALLTAVQNNLPYALAGETGNWKIIYQTVSGPRVKSVDIESSQGKVIIDGKEMTINELMDWITLPEKPPTYEDLPLISYNASQTLPLHLYNGFVLRKSNNYPGILAVSLCVHDGKGGLNVDTMRLEPAQDGKFNVAANHGLGVEGSFSLEQIAVLFQKKVSLEMELAALAQLEAELKKAQDVQDEDF